MPVIQPGVDIAPPPPRQALSKATVTAPSAATRRGLLEAPAPVRSGYVRGLVSEIIVERDRAIISGPKAAIAAAITSGAVKSEVPSCVRKWRARKDSNLRPPDS